MKTSSFATAAVLVATSYAATVTLETTACLDPRAPSGWQLEVEMNSGPVARGALNLPHLLSPHTNPTQTTSQKSAASASSLPPTASTPTQSHAKPSKTSQAHSPAPQSSPTPRPPSSLPTWFRRKLSSAHIQPPTTCVASSTRRRARRLPCLCLRHSARLRCLPALTRLLQACLHRPQALQSRPWSWLRPARRCRARVEIRRRLLR
jgi:hypothetical protein